MKKRTIKCDCCDGVMVDTRNENTPYQIIDLIYTYYCSTCGSIKYEVECDQGRYDYLECEGCGNSDLCEVFFREVENVQVMRDCFGGWDEYSWD